MKVKFDSKEFYTFVMCIKKAPKKNTMQILNHIFFTSEGAAVVDLANKVKVEVKSTCSDFFKKAFLIPYSSVLKAIDQIKGAETVEAESMDDKNVLLADGRIIMSAPKFYDEDVPELDSFNEELHEVPTALFVKANEALKFCSTDSTRASLCGVFVDLEDNSFCGTDGCHMKAGTVECENSVPEVKAIINPVLFGYMASGKIKADECQVKVSEHTTNLHCGDITIKCTNIEGPYPNYEACIPQYFDHIVEVNKGELLAAMDAIKAFLPANKQIAIMCDANTLYVNTLNAEMGTEKTVKIGCGNNVKTFKHGFNFDYLKKILDNIPSERIELKSNNPTGATLWMDPEERGTINLLMPIRIDEDYSFNTDNAEAVEAPSLIKKSTSKKRNSNIDIEAIKAELKEELRPIVMEELRRELARDLF